MQIVNRKSINRRIFFSDGRQRRDQHEPGQLLEVHHVLLARAFLAEHQGAGAASRLVQMVGGHFPPYR